MYLLPKEYEAQRALNGLWFDYYRKPLTQAKRNQLAEDFATQWADKVSITKPFIKHPETVKKKRQRTSSINDVLADFIMRIDQKAETSEKYPVYNPDKQVEVSRKDTEKLVYAHETDTDEDNKRTITESEIVAQVAHQAKQTPSVEDVRRELAKIKEFPLY